MALQPAPAAVKDDTGGEADGWASSDSETGGDDALGLFRRAELGSDADAAAEAYWNDYIQGKLELVQNVLMEIPDSHESNEDAGCPHLPGEQTCAVPKGTAKPGQCSHRRLARPHSRVCMRAPGWVCARDFFSPNYHSCLHQDAVTWNARCTLSMW